MYTVQCVHNTHILYGLLAQKSLRLFSLFARLFILYMFSFRIILLLLVIEQLELIPLTFIYRTYYVHAFIITYTLCVHFIFINNNNKKKPVACVLFIHTIHTAHIYYKHSRLNIFIYIYLWLLNTVHAHENQLMEIFGCVCVS